MTSLRYDVSSDLNYGYKLNNRYDDQKMCSVLKTIKSVAWSYIHDTVQSLHNSHLLKEIVLKQKMTP